MSKRSFLTVGFIVGGLVLVSLLLKAVIFPPEKPKSVIEVDGDKSRQQLIDEGEIVAEDVELVQGKNGTLDWKLLAKTAKYNQEKKLIGVVAPRLTAYYDEDRREVFISADRGEVDQGNDNLTLYDNVTGRFGNLDVYAPYMDYVGVAGKVFVRGGVHVRKPDMNLTADEAEINLTKRVLTATGNVTAILSSVGMQQ